MSQQSTETYKEALLIRSRWHRQASESQHLAQSGKLSSEQGALEATLLSNIMNSDPKIVHYVNDSGLAGIVFRMIKVNQFGTLDKNGLLDAEIEDWNELDVPPPIPELIMSLPKHNSHPISDRG